MLPPPITVELNKYGQIEILRAEILRVEEELKETEKQLRAILLEEERQNFLRTVHVMYQTMQWPEPAGDLNRLNATRNALFDALQGLQTAMGQLEADGGKGSGIARTAQPAQPVASAPSALGGPRRQKFDSFDEFRAKQGDK